MDEIETLTERAHFIARTSPVGESAAPLLAMLVEAVERLTTVVERLGPADPRRDIVIGRARAASRAEIEAAFADHDAERAAPPTLYRVTSGVNVIGFTDGRGSIFVDDLLYQPLDAVAHRISALDRLTIEVTAPGLPKVDGRLRVLRQQAHTREYVTIWEGPIIESDPGRLLAADAGLDPPTLKVRDA